MREVVKPVPVPVTPGTDRLQPTYLRPLQPSVLRDYVDFSYECEAVVAQCNVDKASTLREIERLKDEASAEPEG